MKNAINELWYGNIQPLEATTPTAEMREIYRHISKQKDDLREMLSDDGKAILDKLADNFYETSSLLAREAFRHGFKLGASLMLDALDDERS
ncbi:MAG: hypothetical protein J6B72_05920 [Clostridia bacterium]|nr:hypothetical protein [Clostridia bacterium]